MKMTKTLKARMDKVIEARLEAKNYGDMWDHSRAMKRFEQLANAIAKANKCTLEQANEYLMQEYKQAKVEV